MTEKLVQNPRAKKWKSYNSNMLFRLLVKYYFLLLNASFKPKEEICGLSSFTQPRGRLWGKYNHLLEKLVLIGINTSTRARTLLPNY